MENSQLLALGELLLGGEGCGLSISVRLASVKTGMYTRRRAGDACREAPVSWVHDRIFAAGGHQIPETWAAFQDQTGIDAVVHLSPGRPMVFAGPAPAAFLWLDVSQEEAADLATRRLAGGFVLDCIKDGRTVLLHSGLSRHRTRWVFVAFLLASGASVARALRQAEERPWLSPYPTDETRWQALSEALHDHPLD